MRAIDIILKKRGFKTIPSEPLTHNEIAFFIKEYVAGKIPDYQASALLMAIYFNGMNADETASLTELMLNSGKRYDFSDMGFFCVDKHSTGGVGDKISIPLAAIVAACGGKVPMMSGRALGITGGTLDKLDSITGYRSNLSEDEFKSFVAKNNYAMTSQTAEVVPADKLLYALRDVSGTVESVPLITSSILSKKIAEGSNALVFDVKCGAGAFMKTLDEAEELATSLVKTAGKMDKKVVALITDMSEPLGRKIGNFLEIEESIDILKATGPDDVRELTLSLASWMLLLAGISSDTEKAYKKASEAIKSGAALEYFYKNVEMQGGDLKKLKSDIGKRRSQHSTVIRAEKDAYIAGIDAMKVGQAGVYLGVGRNKTTDTVCAEAGLIFEKKSGDSVKAGDIILHVYGKDSSSVDEAIPLLKASIRYSYEKPEKRKQILKLVEA